MYKLKLLTLLLLFTGFITACSTYDERRLTGGWTIKKTINLPQNSDLYSGSLISFTDKYIFQPKYGSWSLSSNSNQLYVNIISDLPEINGTFKLTFKPQNNSHKPPYVFLEATNPDKPSYELVRFEVDLNDYVY